MNLEVKNIKNIPLKNEFREKEILIRNYRTSDYAFTLEILEELYDTYHRGLKEGEWKPSSGLRLFKPNLKRVTLIAELKSTGEVIGMGVIEALKSALGHYIGYLYNWAIKKRFVGKSIGKILADQAIQILKSWGCNSIRINLGYKTPEKLINVFKNIGFKPIMIVLEKRFEN